MVILSCKLLPLGSFNNYVDRILPFFDHPCVDSFYTLLNPIPKIIWILILSEVNTKSNQIHTKEIMGKYLHCNIKSVVSSSTTEVILAVLSSYILISNSSNRTIFFWAKRKPSRKIGTSKRHLLELSCPI